MAQATFAAANALASGTFTSHLSRPHAASDSRLLANLIKSERNYISNLHSTVSSAHAASSALSAWGTSEAPDVADTSSRLSSLLSACTDVQNTHVAAIEGYRAALKDVADREASIRNVVRDRDILVSRLIKASNKSASNSSKKSPEERAEKVAIAQRELQACEEVLTSEEAALVGVKRRTFKEALTMRMKTMGDAGAAMVDAAQEAILLLDAFDSNAHQMPHSPIYDDSMHNGQEWYSYQQHPHNTEESNEERMVAMNPNFENSSVTPSQSASQVYQPQYQRNSAAYSAPFRGIGETEGEAQRYSEQQVDSDSDDEDWRRSFAQGQHTMVHQGGGTVLPAPHQLSADVGTHRLFMPMENQKTPAPTPPAKDSDKQLSVPSRNQSVKKKKKLQSSQLSKSEREFGPLNTVAMPPVPTAPRLNTSGVDMGPIPSAPKLYMPGASGDQDDSSSEEEDNRNTVSHRGGWTSRQNNDGASSDGEATARQSSRPDGIKRGNSFFGKVGKLFKTDMKGEAVSSKHDGNSSRPRKGSIGSSWGSSKTDSYLKESRKQGTKDPSTLSRKQSVLRGPIGRDGQDSSDDEPIDERKLVRVTNPRRPLWQGEKPSSDVGTKSVPKDGLKRPTPLKRTSSASVTAGPLSWKAKQEAELARQRAEEEAAAAAAAAVAATNLTRSSTGTPSLKKKKKKSTTKRSASLDGGSEVGTQSTRTKATIPIPEPMPNQRHSVVVTGDASAGIRRSDSLNYGTMKSSNNGKLAKKSSKRLSAMSTQNMHSSASPRQGAMSPVDRQGKFTTNSWVAKSNYSEDEGNGISSSVPPKATHTAAATTPSKLKQSHTPAAKLEPKHVPQPSASMSPPLKPALKVPGSSDLARTGSVASSAAGSAMPYLPPPVTAPPPVTSMKMFNDSSINSGVPSLTLTGGPNKSPASVLSIEEDKRFDGTGRLDVSNYDDSAEAQAGESRRQPGMALPRIDMPTSEPFKVDLDSKRGGGSKPTTPMRESSAGELMTPGEQSAYQTFMSQNDGNSPERAHDNQPSGVTRFTDRIAAVGRGVLGVGSGSPQRPNNITQTAPGKLSRSYSDQKVHLSSDSSEDEGEPAKAKTPVVPSIAALANTNNSLTTSNIPASQASETSVEGSGVGRRKSVRMAPDVKLPPETPTDDHHQKTTSYDFTTPGSTLSSRIAPPPQAPPRLSAHQDKPLDIGAHPREVQGWSIRTNQLDDSSDEDQDDYQQARKSFGDVSKSWGKSSKTKKSSKGASEGGGTSGSIKKKKKKAPSDSGYNPAIPLPAGMEVVGRSGSIRR